MAEFEKLDEKRKLTDRCDRGGRIPFDVNFSGKGFDFDHRTERPFLGHNGFTHWVKRLRR
jgi:hypothetical protein